MYIYIYIYIYMYIYMHIYTYIYIYICAINPLLTGIHPQISYWYWWRYFHESPIMQQDVLFFTDPLVITLVGKWISL